MDSIREQLQDHREITDEKKVAAIYPQTLKVEEKPSRHIPKTFEYTDEEKAELDRRVDYYLNGGKMVTREEMNLRLKAIREKIAVSADLEGFVFQPSRS